MDASDITPARLAHAMRECCKLEGNKEMDERLEFLAHALLQDNECALLLANLRIALITVGANTPRLLVPITLGIGIMIGINMAKQVEELRSLEMLT